MLLREESRTERARGEWKTGTGAARVSGEGQRELEPERTQIGSAARVCVRVRASDIWEVCETQRGCEHAH